MRKKICFLAVILLLFMIPPASAESGKELVENSVHFDNKVVTLRGEVVGVLMRGDYAWVNVLDNEVAIGVWCRANDAKKVSIVGDYTHTGDTVEVVGTFHFACTEHGGDLDIHAENFTVLASGKVVERAPNLLIVLLSTVLVAVAILTVFWLRRLRKERSEIAPWPMSWT
jgi:hypothetical protein